MALIVQKFGGTSVANTDRIKNVAKRVARWKALGHDVIVVPSAMSGETNRLIASNKVEGTAVYDRTGNRLGSVYNFMVD